MCHWHNSTGCERGSYCTFAHDEAELGDWYKSHQSEVLTHKIALCRYVLRGKACRNLAKYGRCEFAHGECEQGTPKIGTSGDTTRACDTEWGGSAP